MENSLKHTFDEVAELYRQARPSYPEALISSLIEVSNLTVHSDILEIGAGTGQATKPLAQKGFRITAIELGASMAQVLQQQLHDYKNVQVVTGSFEATPLPTASFDLIFAATAFHWIEPAIRFSKSHAVMKEDGHLAIIHTNHISDEQGDEFFNASQPIYDRHGFTDKRQKPALPVNAAVTASDIDTNLFKLVHFQLYPVTLSYTARQYVQLLNTYSNHLAASKEVQSAFYNDIESLIHKSFQGKINKCFSMSLTIAKKI